LQNFKVSATLLLGTPPRASAPLIDKINQLCLTLLKQTVMKNIIKLTWVLTAVLMIAACQEEPIVNNVDQIVVKSASFETSDYYVVNNPNSVGAIYFSNTGAWKVGDKIRVSGTIKFKKADDSGYVISEYRSNCEIKYVTDNAIYLDHDYSGIGRVEDKTMTTHIEFNRGVIELFQSVPSKNS
jgi:hypothetical protein